MDDVDLVIFGGLGSLALTKLLPALFNLHVHNEAFGAHCRILLADRDVGGWQKKAEKACGQASRGAGGRLEPGDYGDFRRLLDCVEVDVEQANDYQKIGRLLRAAPDRTRVFYMAIPPELLLETCENVTKLGLNNGKTRVAVEKPIGTCHEDARSINDRLDQMFGPGNVFRIDHYLGKEAVQNLFMLRFANRFLEPLWNRDNIEHVQITLAEQQGVGTRIKFYDQVGALRDMVQNHMLQLVSLIAMDPPASLEADAIHLQKLAVLKALRPLESDVRNLTVRGQYIGYEEELGMKSSTETFVALKLNVDNHRWCGVPFFLRTGKKMAQRYSEVVIHFRSVPHQLFRPTDHFIDDKLVLRLQPDAGISFLFMHRLPSLGPPALRPASLDFRVDNFALVRVPDAYERLLRDIITDDHALFVHRAEIEEAWKWIDSVVRSWEEDQVIVHPYDPGTEGPSATHYLIGTADARRSYRRSWPSRLRHAHVVYGGPNERKYVRNRCNEPARLVAKGVSYSCQIVDVSVGGVRLRGRLDVAPGDLARLDSDELGRKAVRVVWHKQRDVGLAFTRAHGST